MSEQHRIEPCNIATALPRLAREHPAQVAMRCPGRNGAYDVALSYAELDARSDAIAAGLAGRGIVRGSRTVVMVRPTPEFFLLMFALFKAGAVPVLVDPGIDRRALKQCLDEAKPEAFIGIPLAMLAKALLGWAKSSRVRISTGRRAWLADATLAEVERDGAHAGPQHTASTMAETQPDDVAALLFTSGSTGVPKGVVYRHRHFVAQIAMLRDAFGIEAGGIDLPTFPPFALFDPALGLTSIIPDMDPTRPAKADPRKLHAAIKRFGTTQLFGSPALMRVLAEHGEPLPTVKRVTSAGAPVPPEVVAKMLDLLPADAQLWTPYGATECLPVAVIEGRELLTLRERTEAGAGTCVGRPVAPNDVRIIEISDEPIADWWQATLVPDGVVGEITVAGPSATDAYFNRDAQTTLAKIREGANRSWWWSMRLRPCARNRSSRCSTRIRMSRAVRWSVSGRRARSGRCCAWNCDATSTSAHGRASRASCATSPTAWCTPQRSTLSCATRKHSRSISATTPRSAARNWLRGRRRSPLSPPPACRGRLGGGKPCAKSTRAHAH